MPFFSQAQKKTVLAIETSCDETAVSILTGYFKENNCVTLTVHSHIVESQTKSHAPFGGVVPEVAARDHLTKIYDIALTALKESKLKISDINCIAVTMGPGLIGALMVGILFARGLATALNIPLVAINHIDAHLAPALFLSEFYPAKHLQIKLTTRPLSYPLLALTVSGGHCHLSYLTSSTERQILARSLDDACGEAFDKIAKLLGLEYPGGPLVEVLAKQAEENGNTKRFNFPYKLNKKEHKLAFSYSGIKTAVMEVIRKETKTTKGKISGAHLAIETKQELAYAFQEAALKQLFDRVEQALIEYPQAKEVLVAGGVAQNKKFREFFSKLKTPVHFAPSFLCSDNATMIGLHALINYNELGYIKQPFSRYDEA